MLCASLSTTGVLPTFRLRRAPPRAGQLDIRSNGAPPRLNAPSGWHGFSERGLDAATGKYVELIEAGIIDATKVVRIAVENAVSVASSLVLSEATLLKSGKGSRSEAPTSEFA